LQQYILVDRRKHLSDKPVSHLINICYDLLWLDSRLFFFDFDEVFQLTQQQKLLLIFLLLLQILLIRAKPITF
jgi:hypothetical protein